MDGKEAAFARFDAMGPEQVRKSVLMWSQQDQDYAWEWFRVREAAADAARASSLRASEAAQREQMRTARIAMIAAIIAAIAAIIAIIEPLFR